MVEEARDRSAAKRRTFEYLLCEERSVFVYLDPRPPDVVVPGEFKGQPVLNLQFGLNLPVHTELQVEDDGLVTTLSFHRRPFRCEVPWTAVFAIVGESDHRGRVFEQDVPAEVRAVEQQERREKPLPSHQTERRRTLPPGWSVVDGGKNAGGGPTGDPAA